MSNPFQHPELRNWFFRGVRSGLVIPSEVCTHGSTPFQESEFDRFLASFGISGQAWSPELNVLVVGREGWEAEYLNEAAEDRRGKELRVYSQEMFLAFMGGMDPLEQSQIALIFGEGHPALEHIRDWGFDWPTTRVVPYPSGLAVPAQEGWKKESLLKLMGYTAGAGGKNVVVRRMALMKAFTANLSDKADPEYVAEWGQPQSGQRLYKIVERIALNITLHAPQGHREAVSQWVDDLSWLKSKYYDERHTFRWPDIHA